MKTNLLSKVAALTVALCFTGTMSVFADDPFTERTTGGVIYRVYSDHAVAADVDHTRANVPETVYILSEVDGKPVTELLGDAFNYQHFVRTQNKEPHKENVANIKHMTIPKTVKTIGGWCFLMAPNLEDVTFEEGSQLTTIGRSAFEACSALKRFFIPKSVTNLEGYAFKNCGDLETVVFEEGSTLTEIKDFTFQSCFLLSSINVPNTVTRICNEAFKFDASLTALPLPPNLTFVGQAVFCECIGVETPVVLPKTLKTVKWAAFEKVPMKQIVFPKTLVNVGPWSFKSTGLENIYFEYDGNFPEVLPFNAFHWNEEGFYGHAFENLRANGFCQKTVRNIPDVIKDNNNAIVVTMQKVNDIAATGIETVPAEKVVPQRKGIYSLSGVKMNGAQKLPAGIYIINGKKCVITK